MEKNLTQRDYESLAEFRHQIRRFLRFSERAARGTGLEPRQHQLLRRNREVDLLLGEAAMDFQVDRLLDVHVAVEVGGRHEVHGFEFQ